MAHNGSVSLPRAAIAPVAVVVARRAKIVAIITAICCLTFIAFGISQVINDPPTRNDVACGFWVVVFGVSCVLAVLRAKRVTAAAKRAASEIGSTWTLVGNLVVAADDRNQPLPEHSFKITRGLRKLLLSDQTQAASRSAQDSSASTIEPSRMPRSA